VHSITHQSRKILVVGATVLYDYIYKIDRLPQPGLVANILDVDDLHTRYFGGTTFNVAVQLAKLGERVILFHPVGKDFPGSEYESYLSSYGIQLEYLQLVPEKNSGVAYVFFTEDGSTLCFSYPIQGPNVNISNSIFKQVDLVVFTPKFGAIPENLVQQVIDLAIPVAIVGVADAAIRKFLSRTMLLSLNINETNYLSKALGDITVEEITRRMPGVLYETNGDKGCKIYQGGEMVGQVTAIPPNEMIDSTGAGDTFSAGVLAGLRRDFKASEAAQIGAAAASYVLEAYGCHTNMPDWKKILTRLKKSNTELAQRIASEVNK